MLGITWPPVSYHPTSNPDLFTQWLAESERKYPSGKGFSRPTLELQYQFLHSPQIKLSHKTRETGQRRYVAVFANFQTQKPKASGAEKL